jgi:hypothetical protein
MHRRGAFRRTFTGAVRARQVRFRPAWRSSNGRGSAAAWRARHPRRDSCNACASAGEYPLCLDLIARGIINVKPMIETVAPLAEGAAWFDKLSAKDGGKYMKVILTP